MMKYLLTLIFLFISVNLFSQEIRVIQINADWNHKNTLLNLEELQGCIYQFGWLKHQPASIQDALSSVPVILIYEGDKLVKRYDAGISLKLKVSLEEIQQEINAIREN